MAPYGEHSNSHQHMLVFSCKLENSKEILGQLPHLIIDGVKSFVGEIPVGNSGIANVPPLKSMQVPEDLKMNLK